MPTQPAWEMCCGFRRRTAHQFALEEAFISDMVEINSVETKANPKQFQDLEVTNNPLTDSVSNCAKLLACYWIYKQLKSLQLAPKSVCCPQTCVRLRQLESKGINPAPYFVRKKNGTITEKQVQQLWKM